MQPSGTAGAPSLSTTVDATTNRLLVPNALYDNNGNLYRSTGGVYVYDPANRMVEAMESAGNYFYGYDPDNRRIYYRDVNNHETIYFYGADGQKLATYTYTIIQYITQGNPEIQLLQQSSNVYFLGKLITAENAPVTADRLGSVRSGGPGGLGYQAQYPYGVEYTLTANDREKYATYTRDSLTGFDYAVNRYYSSQWGRFLTPDPYVNSAGLGDPGGWNRYAYTGNDPVNRNDPSGQNYVLISSGWCWGGGEETGSWYPCDTYGFAGFFQPLGLGSGGGGGGGYQSPFPKCNPGNSPGEDANLAFIAKNYAAASEVAVGVGFIGADAVLAWAVSEVGYGTGAAAKNGNNFFNQSGNSATGAGQADTIPCPNPSSMLIGGASYVCFSGFQASATSAFFMDHYTWTFDGTTGWSVASIIQAVETANPNTSTASLFQTIANSGQDRAPSPTNAGYGQRVATDLNGVDKRLNCLTANGYIP
jgi:RHS repeat-associated protein